MGTTMGACETIPLQAQIYYHMSRRPVEWNSPRARVTWMYTNAGQQDVHHNRTGMRTQMDGRRSPHGVGQHGNCNDEYLNCSVGHGLATDIRNCIRDTFAKKLNSNAGSYACMIGSEPC